MTRTGSAIAVITIGGLVVAQAGLVWIAPGLAGVKPTTFAQVMPLMALLAVPAAVGLAVAIVALRREAAATAPPPWLLPAILAAGLAMRLMWLDAPAPLEDDFYRYLWDGAVVANGFNPYRWPPNLLEQSIGLHTAPIALARLLEVSQAASGILPRINFPDLTTIYPGTAQLAFALAYHLQPFGLDGLRLVFLAADCAAAWAVLALLARLGQPALLVATYWLNPLVVFVGIGIAHADVLMVPLVLAALLASLAARPFAVAGCLALAAGVKLWPILLAPLLLRRTAAGTPRTAVAALAVCAVATLVLTLPLLLSAWQVGSGLRAYAASWHINNAPYAWASYGIYLLFGESEVALRGLRVAVALAAVAITLALAVTPVRCPRELVIRALILTAAIFYLSPAQFPWYALWFLPLAAVLPSFPLLAASATLAAYYTFFPLWETGRGPLFQYGAALLHSTPVWAWLAYVAVASRRTRRTSAVSPA